jgi:hypothetical protein
MLTKVVSTRIGTNEKILNIQSPSIQIGALVGAFSAAQYDQYSNTPGCMLFLK